jgi:acetyl-CoA carboxylase biotin carboxyl carrier protein
VADELEARHVARLLGAVRGSDVELLEVESGDIRVVIRRRPELAPPPRQTDAASGATQAPDGEDRSRELGETRPGSDAIAVTSTLVGVFFRGREAGGAPLTDEGVEVQSGQTLAIIESLGVPHPIDSPADGSLEGFLVEDGHPVEYGQPLLVLRRGARS